MSVTLFEAFEQFLNRPKIKDTTRSKYLYRLRPFIALNGTSTSSSITTAMILAHIDAQTHLADPSKSILRQCFHALFEFCLKKGLITSNPASDLPRWRDTPRYIHVPDECEVKGALNTAVKMCESDMWIDQRDGLVFVLAVYSGCRRGELRNLDIGDLEQALANPKGDIYRAYTKGKTGEAIMRFSRFHVPYIEKYLQIRPKLASTAVFVNLNASHPDYGKKLSLTAFNRIRRKICDRASVPSVTYQELRRRLATIIARSEGVDVASHALNHSPYSGDRVIRLFYYDPDVEKVDDATAKAFNGIGT